VNVAGGALASLLVLALACRSGLAPASSSGPAPVAADRPEPIEAVDPHAKEDPRYLTEIGSRFLSLSEQIAVGRVRSVSAIHGGPHVARFEVEEDLSERPAAGERAVPVFCAPGALEVSDSPVLLFLGARAPGGFARPLVGVAKGTHESFGELVQLVREAVAIGRRRLPVERRAATRLMWLRHLEDDDRPYLRAVALREAARHVDPPQGWFEAEDAPRLEALASRAQDRRFAASVLGLASRIRANYAAAR
jgi:hypothetical protein